MSIISYAQNFEDVMLWRALAHIEQGRYIDIGAQDPVIDSVSLAFHEHGWRGIHVEPTPHYAELLRQQRPGDIVIQAAVCNGPAALNFFEIENKGISTGDAAIAEQHRERGFNVHEIIVPCIPLTSIFDICAGSEIHWLKIDVEGLEKQVLSSWGDAVARPWIVVVESTLPLTQIETHEHWEPILVSYDYTPVYFDGLNRYYVSNAHPELKTAFTTPPNLFDGFTLNGTASAPFHKLIEARYQTQVSKALEQVEQIKQSSNNDIEQLNLHIASLNKINNDRQQEITAQLQTISQQALQEKAALVLNHNEQERTLHDQYAKRETVITLQLQKAQEQLYNLQQDREKREQVLSEQISRAREQLNHFFQSQVQREKEIAAQMFANQQQATQEMAIQARRFTEQSDALLLKYSERENDLRLQLQAEQHELRQLQQERVQCEKEHAEQNSKLRQDLESRLYEQLQREREIAAELLALQQQTAQEKAALVLAHQSQERELQRQHAEREQALMLQKETVLQEVRQQEKQWALHEKELDKEIADLQREVQAQSHASQLQIQRYEAELDNHQNENKHLIASCAELELRLKTEIQMEQKTILLLQQSLAELQQNMASTHASFSWRITAPLRKLASLVAGKPHIEKEESIASVIPVEATHQAATEACEPENLNVEQSPLPLEKVDTPVGLPSHSELETINIQLMPVESNMLTSVPSSLDDLLACHDKQFIFYAYKILLGREPDPEGLNYYLGWVRKGYSKIQILSQLRLSAEGKTQAETLSGLDRAIRCYKRGQYPLIGWLFRRSNSEGNHAIERKLRCIENQIFLLSDESSLRFNQLEMAISRLNELVVLSQTRTDQEPTITDTTNSPILESSEVNNLSHGARSIYLQLKNMVAANAKEVV